MKRSIIAIFSTICIIFVLAGCAKSPWLYRVSIQQGNVVTADHLQQLRVGMTKEAVCELLGPPILLSGFNENRWSYIYTFKPGKGKYLHRSLILYFRNNHVASFKTKNINS